MLKEPPETQVGPTILVVDDSPTVRKIVQKVLEPEGIRVLMANDGLTALASIVGEKPAVIFLDTHLPQMDGYSVCKIVRKNPLFRQIPIIMLRSRHKRLDKLRCWLAEATDSLIKPLDRLELIETTKKYLRNGPELLP